MFKFALKKQSAQVNLHATPEQVTVVSSNDETVNISKFPLLYATPERRLTKEPAYIAINRINSSFEISKLRSPVEHADCTAISYDDTRLETNNVTANAFINQLCDSPLCSTAVLDSCCSCCDSIGTECSEATVASEETSEQFHSVNASFFDFNTRQVDSQDMLYVCCKTHQASDVSQISLCYSDIVKLVYVKGEFCLVQHLATDKRGYVPSSCISKLAQSWINDKPLSL